ncbi:hypothetical protein SRHO_G00065450 [Serrasalmus rhombeus]
MHLRVWTFKEVILIKKMQVLSWLCAAVVLCACRSGADGQCWDTVDCTNLGSEEKIVECIWQCRSKQLVFDAKNVLTNQEQSTVEEEKDSLSLGVLTASLPQDDVLQAKRSSTGPLRTNERRSYSMEHFRWGKPTGRKRRPIKIHTGSSVEEESSAEQSMETQRRRQLDSNDEGAPSQKKNTKSTEKYRMMHFRWSTPPAAKRYGGFMKLWSEPSNKPLITLLRNIVKDGQ